MDNRRSLLSLFPERVRARLDVPFATALRRSLAQGYDRTTLRAPARNSAWLKPSSPSPPPLRPWPVSQADSVTNSAFSRHWSRISDHVALSALLERG